MRFFIGLLMAGCMTLQACPYLRKLAAEEESASTVAAGRTLATTPSVQAEPVCQLFDRTPFYSGAMSQTKGAITVTLLQKYQAGKNWMVTSTGKLGTIVVFSNGASSDRTGQTLLNGNYGSDIIWATICSAATDSPSSSPTAVPSTTPTATPSTATPTTAEPSTATPTTTAPSTATPTATPSVAPTSNLLPDPFCQKTNGAIPVPTHDGICTAYSNVYNSFLEVLPTTQLNRSNLFGQSVRLAFHDAGEFSQSASDLFGPDGCLSLAVDDSKGIIEQTSLVYTVLEPIWQQNCDLISRADFWVLFAKFVLEESSAGNMTIPFQYGRNDAVGGCALSPGRLPNAVGGLGEIDRVFADNMGLTREDAVTLIGAHTIGHVHTDHSGFGFAPITSAVTNAWDTTPDVFDNHYYINQIRIGWKNTPSLFNGKAQWKTGTVTVMLNMDMVMSYPADVHNGIGTPGQRCAPINIKVNTSTFCQNPANGTVTETFPLVNEYATSVRAFQAAFPVSFVKMTTVGYGQTNTKLGTVTDFDPTTCPVSSGARALSARTVFTTAIDAKTAEEIEVEEEAAAAAAQQHEEDHHHVDTVAERITKLLFGWSK